ncbi:MAG: hypothetical protein QM680_04545 [Luteolibacter sp.]
MRNLDDWLNSEESAAPFTHCIHCKLPLLEIAEPWLVNKEYHREECILEYAICQPCRDQTTGRISAESKAAVCRFLENQIDWEERVRELLMMQDPCDRFAACIVCQTPRELLEGYSISVHFNAAGELIMGPLPLLICKSCTNQMMALLCEESRAVWKNFLSEHFPGPPESGFPGVL